MEVAPHKHTLEEALELAWLQVLQLLVSASTGAMFGSWWAGEAMDFSIPWDARFVWVIGALALWMLWHLVDRNRVYWDEASHRAGIAAGFIQIGVTGLVLGLACGIAVLIWPEPIDEATMMRWFLYGALAGAAAQTVAAIVGMVWMKLVPVVAE